MSSRGQKLLGRLPSFLLLQQRRSPSSLSVMLPLVGADGSRGVAPQQCRFLYRLHEARQQLLCPSRAAALYLCAARYGAAEHAAANAAAELCARDAPLGECEAWCVEQLHAAAAHPHHLHPAAAATRLALYEACAEGEGEGGSDAELTRRKERRARAKADAATYFGAEHLVAVECRLPDAAAEHLLDRLALALFGDEDDARGGGSGSSRKGRMRMALVVNEEAAAPTPSAAELLLAAQASRRLRLPSNSVPPGVSAHGGGGFHRLACLSTAETLCGWLATVQEDGVGVVLAEWGSPTGPRWSAELTSADLLDGRSPRERLAEPHAGEGEVGCLSAAQAGAVALLLLEQLQAPGARGTNVDLAVLPVAELLRSPHAEARRWGQLVARDAYLMLQGIQGGQFFPAATMAVLSALCALPAEAIPPLTKQGGAAEWLPKLLQAVAAQVAAAAHGLGTWAKYARPFKFPTQVRSRWLACSSRWLASNVPLPDAALLA